MSHKGPSVVDAAFKVWELPLIQARTVLWLFFFPRHWPAMVLVQTDA